MTNLQAQAGEQSLPFLSPVLQFLAQNAGLPGVPANVGGQPVPQGPAPSPAFSGGQRGFGTATRLPGAGQASIFPVGGVSQASPQAGVLPDSALGIFGQGADALRFQQAEDDINRLARLRAQQLQFRLGQQGIGASGIGAGAQTQLQQSALQDLANFRRQLAIGAQQEQERRVQQLLAALGLGTSQAGQAQQQLGVQQQLAAQNQANQFQALIGLGSVIPGFKGLF